MTIILENGLINMDNVIAVYVDDGLIFEIVSGTLRCKSYPDNVLQQIAVASAECKPFLELEDTQLDLEYGNDTETDS